MTKTRVKRDYSIKSYSNQLFNKRKSTLKKNKNIFKIKILLLITLIILFLSAIGYILYGSYFRIISIVIEGNNDIKTSDISWFIDEELNKSLIFPNNNYLFIDKNLANNIKNKFYFKEVAVKKIFPNSLVINVIEKVPAIILIVGDKKYLLDGDGTMMGVMDPSKADEYDNLIKIVDESNNVVASILITTNATLVDSNEMLFIYKILNFADKNNLKINQYEKKEFNELSVELESGIKVMFDTTEGLEKQIDKLATVMFNINEVKEYIDVRFGDKVFYK